jgi:hypothetical protein
MVASTGCDEFTHECLAIRVARKFKAIDVIDVLSDLFILRGHSRSHPVRQRTGVPRQGGAGQDRGCRCQIVIESWRRHYNTIRPHASIGYKLPAPEVFVPAFAPWPAALRRLAPPATLAQRPTLN